MSLVCFSTATVHADEQSSNGGATSSGASITEDLKPEDYTPKTGEIDEVIVERYTSRFFNFLYTIAVIISIVMVMYVGLKYITGSVSERAEYKKNLIPMAIGVLLITFLVTIIKVIISTAGSL